MIHIGTYKDFEAAQANGTVVSFTTYVRFTSKLFEFTVLPDGNHILETAVTRYANSKIGDWLAAKGLSGLLFISAGGGPSKNADRWIERFANTDRSEWGPDYTVYNLNGVTADHIQPLPTSTLTLNITPTDNALDSTYGDLWDGFLIVADTEKGKRYFRKLPNRQIEGSIIATVPDGRGKIGGVLVKVKRNGTDYMIRTRIIPKWLRETKDDPMTFLRRTCVISYTQFTPGDRVTNFSSARVIAITHKRSPV